MKQAIQERTEWEKKFKAKYQELDNIKQQISDINNTDLFNMTFEQYSSKPLLQEYYDKQQAELVNRINAIRNDRTKGTLEQQITRYIRQQADNSENVAQAFKAFESNPNNSGLKEAYTEVFNAKVDELHNEALGLLDKYFETVDDRTGRILKTTLKHQLPAPISVVDIETKRESDIRGLSFDYATRTSTRKI